MGEYRHIETGEIKTQGQWRNHYKNVSLPRTWTAATLEGLKLETVFEAPKPTPEAYQTVVRNGVDYVNGNWVTAWAIHDMFADTTTEDGTVTTKADHEAAYQARLDENASTSIRSKRDTLLAETDWVVTKAKETGATIPAAWKTYRQALRDITSHANWPHLNDEDWPVKPV
jgi:hypothetical protein